jgi:ISXO2-like transposase domain
MRRGDAHLRLIDDAGAKTLTKAAGAQISPGADVKSDDCSAYRAPPGAAYPPRAARRAHAAGRRRVAALRCTSSPSNFTRWRLDIFQGVSAAHLQSYRDELRYRLWPP